MSTTESSLPAPLAERIGECPRLADAEGAARDLADLREAIAADPALAELGSLLGKPPVLELISGTLGGSPYLTALIRRDPARLLCLLTRAPELREVELAGELEAAMAAAANQAEAMRALRVYKAEMALLIALADLAGAWPVMRVTAALTAAADTACRTAIRFLFRIARTKGDWLGGRDGEDEAGSGYMVLAMGKHGAHELNYSSDIDLIVFFEPGLVRLREGLEPLAFFVRMTKDLVRLLQERTGDGYVFRTDLRLRPDPGATQVAISSDAALLYYESFGQNWERAALIKARPIAGDLAAGRSFVKELAPFIWRKYLDFAAITDIHAMKRQIHAFKGFGTIGVAGHNIKLGRGGIREIEFFAQTQQLIAGGRQSDLRVPDTLSALRRLTERGWIKEAVRADLEASYLFLRRLEHRLQMIADEQTQTLPAEPQKLAALARFAGFEDTPSLSAALIAHLERVQRHYAALFEDTPELTTGGANMVFAGEADDPATVEALARMGYTNPSTIIAAVRGWHHGRYPAVRSARARERLTEVQPALIEALGKTADPDLAFMSFDRLLQSLPAGVQLFSLLRANPDLLRLVANIMGSAPRLARILSRRRRVLDAVLDPGFFGSLPTETDLATIIDQDLAGARDHVERLDRARVVGSEQAFLIGVRVLTGTISAAQAGGAYAQLAEHLIQGLQASVEEDLARAHGRVPGGAAVVVAMGKLGGREMTAASDLDLIVVYDHDAEATQSDGPRPLAPMQYYTRLTQRLIAALSAPTAEGTLYEVDMRLRPSGQKGPVATSLASFIDYQASSAWTWEHLALTRARAISGPPALRAAVTRAIHDVLVKRRERAKIAVEVRDMRARIEKEKGTTDIWDLKQVRGGLVDIEFIAQFLVLVSAADHPEVIEQNTLESLKRLATAGVLPAAAADVLIPAAGLINNLTQVLRLTIDGAFEPEKAPDGLKGLLARSGEVPDFAHLAAALTTTLNETAEVFDNLVV